MEKIYSDVEVFEQFKDKSKKAYIKAWMNFKNFNPNFKFEEVQPGEEDIIAYFKHLRLVKKVATSSMWTIYSYINSVIKRKYGIKLQSLPRVTMLIKGFEEDIKKKAAIFDEALLKKFMAETMENTYWEVRQAIAITAYFGGLRLLECMDLKLEQITRGPDGYTITHTRAKQRSDKMATKYLVPQTGGYATQLANYINKVNSQLEKFQGRVWYAGKKHSLLASQVMGRNMVARVPHDIAARLALMDPSKYTFHSFRRTSATSAADAGATTEQMVDFYGWKNGSMCQEYVSSSRPAIMSMANRLAESIEVSRGKVDPITGKEVPVVYKLQQEDETLVLEEDPEMYSKAGIPFTSSSSTIANQQGVIEATIKQAISAVPAIDRCNISLKVVVVNSMSGNVNM
jgi:integrase